MNRVFKIGNTNMPFPDSGFGVGEQDISDEMTGRSLSGLMDKYIVAQKRKFTCQWTNLSDSKASFLLQAVKGNSLQDARGKTFVQMTYPDPISGTDETRTFYTGDVTATAKVCINDVYYWNVVFDFIEQ